MIELLRRDQSATLEALIVATGWLPHSARAALTGLRHSGYDVRLERDQNGSASVYRIDASQASAGERHASQRERNGSVAEEQFGRQLQ